VDWDDLRYFLSVARTGSLAGAARTMGVKHTTVGRRLTALEASLGAPLVLRHPDGVVLTALGARIAAIAEDAERAVAAVHDAARAQPARVRVAVPSGVGKLVSPHLARFHREHPGISLELLSGSRPVDLGRGEADVAVRIGPITDPELIARTIGDVGSSLYAAASYLARHPPLTDPTDLRGHELVGYDPSLAATPASQWIEAHAAGATIVLRCREMTELVAAAASGAGIAMLPCWLADDEPALRRLGDEVITRRPLSIVHRREAELAEPVRIAIRLLTGVLQSSARLLAGER
jgi:DNA-binding transcriptional LysR family regulator